MAFRVIKRLSALLSRCAQLEVAAEAAMKQAESASKTARTLLVQTLQFFFLCFDCGIYDSV